MTTDTPRTAAATDALGVACYPVALYAVAGFADFVRFARKLERENAALIAWLSYMVEAADVADDREDLPECFDRDAIAKARATLVQATLAGLAPCGSN